MKGVTLHPSRRNVTLLDPKRREWTNGGPMSVFGAEVFVRGEFFRRSLSQVPVTVVRLRGILTTTPPKTENPVPKEPQVTRHSHVPPTLTLTIVPPERPRFVVTPKSRDGLEHGSFGHRDRQSSPNLRDCLEKGGVYWISFKITNVNS